MKLRGLAELPLISCKDSDTNEVNHTANEQHLDLLNQTVKIQSMDR